MIIEYYGNCMHSHVPSVFHKSLIKRGEKKVGLRQNWKVQNFCKPKQDKISAWDMDLGTWSYPATELLAFVCY